MFLEITLNPEFATEEYEKIGLSSVTVIVFVWGK